MFKVTDAAAAAIRESAKQAKAEDMALRIAAKVIDDKGNIEYGMGFDDKKSEDSSVVKTDEIEIIIDTTSMELLEDCTMDYVEIDNGQYRFIFKNPMDPQYVPPSKQTQDQE